MLNARTSAQRLPLEERDSGGLGKLADEKRGAGIVRMLTAADFADNLALPITLIVRDAPGNDLVPVAADALAELIVSGPVGGDGRDQRSLALLVEGLLEMPQTGEDAEAEDRRGDSQYELSCAEADSKNDLLFESAEQSSYIPHLAV